MAATLHTRLSVALKQRHRKSYSSFKADCSANGPFLPLLLWGITTGLFLEAKSFETSSSAGSSESDPNWAEEGDLYYYYQLIAPISSERTLSYRLCEPIAHSLVRYPYFLRNLPISLISPDPHESPSMLTICHVELEEQELFDTHALPFSLQPTSGAWQIYWASLLPLLFRFL